MYYCQYKEEAIGDNKKVFDSEFNDFISNKIVSVYIIVVKLNKKDYAANFKEYANVKIDDNK